MERATMHYNIMRIEGKDSSDKKKGWIHEQQERWNPLTITYMEGVFSKARIGEICWIKGIGSIWEDQEIWRDNEVYVVERQ
jgi:hypothetical protein